MAFTFNPELLEKYDVQGPRYTSYPTAPEFSDQFSAADYLHHLADSNSLLLPKPLSLYIHIPFCHSLCYYCGCNKIVTQKKARAQAYLNYLYHEIDLISPHIDQDRLVTQMHFGGGTPNYLSTEQFREVLDVVARHFHLSYPEELEISIEIDPRYTDARRIQELAQLGFNRISIGVQDYAADVQAAINRIQSREQVDTVIHSAREHGIRSVSVDLIAGLPMQTRESFADTLAQVVESGVDRIAIYNFAYLPERIRAQKMINVADLPGRETRLLITRDTLQFLSDKGYVHIGMDHFALPDDPLAKALKNQQLKRSFQGYATHAECDQIGFGVSAISQIGDAYMQNSSKLGAYYESLDNDLLPVQRGISLDSDDRVRAHIIQRIMCQQPVNYAAVSARFNLDFSDYFAAELEQLQGFAQDELVLLAQEGFSISTQGRFFLRNIAMVFDRRLQMSKVGSGDKVVRFSRTV